MIYYNYFLLVTTKKTTTNAKRVQTASCDKLRSNIIYVNLLCFYFVENGKKRKLKVRKKENKLNC